MVKFLLDFPLCDQPANIVEEIDTKPVGRVRPAGRSRELLPRWEIWKACLRRLVQTNRKSDEKQANTGQPVQVHHLPVAICDI